MGWSLMAKPRRRFMEEYTFWAELYRLAHSWLNPWAVRILVFVLGGLLATGFWWGFAQKPFERQEAAKTQSSRADSELARLHQAVEAIRNSPPPVIQITTPPTAVQVVPMLQASVQPEKGPKEALLSLANSSLTKDGLKYTALISVGNVGELPVHVNLRVEALSATAGGTRQYAFIPAGVSNGWLLDPNKALERTQLITLTAEQQSLLQARKMEIGFRLTVEYPAEKPTTRYVVEALIDEPLNKLNIITNKREPIEK